MADFKEKIQDAVEHVKEGASHAKDSVHGRLDTDHDGDVDSTDWKNIGNTEVRLPNH